MFTNINSRIKSIPNGTEEVILANIKYLAPKLRDTPIFLVNEDTMDKIYPPEKKRILDKNCLSQTLKRIEDNIIKYLQNSELLTKLLEECRRNIVNTPTIAGVYIPKPNKFIIGLTQQANPVIFLCPERIKSWGNSLTMCKIKNEELIFKTLFILTVYHELAHAYMYIGSKISNTWERTIEESLANTIAFSLLARNYKRRAIITEAILKQPLEYQGYIFWINNTDNYKVFLKLWINREKLKNFLYYDDYYYEYLPRWNYFWYLRRYIREYGYDLIRKSGNKIFWEILALAILREVI